MKVLRDLLPSIKAEQELEYRNMRADLTPDRLHDLILLATGDEDQADKQAAMYLLQQIKAGKVNTSW